MPKAREGKPVMTANNLTQLPPGFYCDSGKGGVSTLCFIVSKYGRGRSFAQRLTVKGERVTRGLGSLKRVQDGRPAGWMTLTEARDEARANYVEARKGKDPFADRPAKGGPKFGEVVAAWIAAETTRWRPATLRRNQGVANLHLAKLAGLPNLAKAAERAGRQAILAGHSALFTPAVFRGSAGSPTSTGRP